MMPLSENITLAFHTKGPFEIAIARLPAMHMSCGVFGLQMRERYFSDYGLRIEETDHAQW